MIAPTESNNKGWVGWGKKGGMGYTVLPLFHVFIKQNLNDVAHCRYFHVSSPHEIGGEFLAVNAGLSTSTGPLAHKFWFEILLHYGPNINRLPPIPVT